MAAAAHPRQVLASLVVGLLGSTFLILGAHAQQTSLGEMVDRSDYDALLARGPGVMDDLAALYRQRRDPDARERVAWAFYRLGLRSEAAARALLMDVEGEDVPDSLRISAQYALGRVSDDPLVVRTLLANMRRGLTPLLRDKAACALTYDQIHLTEAQRVLLFQGLIEALDDEKLDVRAIAIKALQIRTGQTKGYHPRAPVDQRRKAIEVWMRWLQAYREEWAEPP